MNLLFSSAYSISLLLPWKLLTSPLVASRPTERVGSLSGFLVIGCLRLRISDLSVWRCGTDLKGMPTSAPSCLPKITTYVCSRSFHFDGPQSRVDRTASGSIYPGRRGGRVNELLEPPGLSPFVSCILSLCLKDYR